MSTPNVDLSTSAAPAVESPPRSGLAHHTTLRTLTVLIRREFWEHRSLWITPLIMAGLLVLAALPIHFGSHFTDDGDGLTQPQNRLSLFTLMLWGQTVPQFFVMGIVVSFYLQDCLYQERKDRSILFWKSLPVSDAATVLSKLLVGLVIVPLGVYALTVIAGILFQTIWSIRVAAGTLPNIVTAWDTVAWLKVQGLLLYAVIVCILWFAPLAALIVLASAWVRKNVFLWVTLPPVIAIIVERTAFGTDYAFRLLEYRTWGIWSALGIAVTTPQDGNGRVVSLANLFDNVAMAKAFANIDLWLGLAVTAAVVFAAIRIRRYRDDT
jgi:ABC-2 type transport system permease protein